MDNFLSLMIGNQWKRGSGEFFSSKNPATNQVIWQGTAASFQEIDEAFFAAQNAFLSWSSLTIEERAVYLNNFKHLLVHNQKDLAEILAQETGKPLWDSHSEIQAMINKIPISLDAYSQRCANSIRDQKTAVSITRHRPHGVVAVFGPYNFPGHLPNGHIIPALLAGNCVIFKPSELTPLFGQEMTKLWQQANLPTGVLNLVQGGIETGKYLSQHESLQGLFFTGSSATGLSLSKQFGAFPGKILALEMGGNNPLVISELDDIPIAAYLTVLSAYLSSGQRCTCARRLIVIENAQTRQFLDHLQQLIKTIKVGAYTDSPEPFMGPVISSKHVDFLLQKQQELIKLGGQPIIQMERLNSQTGFISPGMMDVTAIQQLPDEEIFGPFLQLIRVNNFKEAIIQANQTQFGLVAGLFSKHPDEYHAFYKQIHAGVINWNTQLTGASSAAPFGGIKGSGNFRPSAFYAADYCSYPTASLEANQLNLPAKSYAGLPFNPYHPDAGTYA